MKQTRDIRPVHGIGLLMALCLIATIVWLTGSPNPEVAEANKPSPAATQQPSAGSSDDATLVASPDSEDLVRKKQKIRLVVESFVPAYYGRDEQLFVGNVEQRTDRLAQRIGPYVTQEFIRRYLTTINNPVDEQIIDQGGNVSAYVSDLSGHIDSPHVDIQRTVRLDGAVVQRGHTRVTLTLVRIDKQWKVDTITEE